MVVNETRSYTHVTEEVKEFSPALGHEVYDLGSDLESAETEKEIKKEGIEAMVQSLKEELDELEGFYDVHAEGKKTIVHEKVERLRALIEVVRVYNLN
ncbi:hypothetical protein [Salinicoccus bachuensis]|uniref:Uncharacterized protein n=1 Tax=Salinicoccus bachuensis TaxID=3136731 RepID=A0ABZ3CJN6_9STAP